MTTCASPSCTNTTVAKLACPKCIQLGLPPTFFCSQDCFKANYNVHKQIHALAKTIKNSSGDDGITAPLDAPLEQKLAPPEWAHNYSFTGDLRPTRLSPRRAVPASIRKPDYASDSTGRSESEERDKRSGAFIPVYTPDELDAELGLRQVNRMGRQVLDLAGRALKPGVTTDEIDRIVHEACLERDCYPSPLNYYNFPKSLCISVNEVICHGIPDYREIKDGDIVNLDISVYNRGGFHSDLNETYMVGSVDEDGKRLVKTAFDCLAAAMHLVKPGTLYRDLGTVIERTAKSNQCSVVRTYCGHGIGSLFHTTPNIPHYAKNKAKGTMKAGHIFTIEPMINLGSHVDRTWDDNWTSVTKDGQRSAQFEHTILVTDSGYDILTQRENEPIMMWNEELNTRF
ncbi:hypothetical protein MPSEU_000153000 [Mayamaea pseudoterrestris]|nr:hypothetical protein MPSEU_000153000 [Mayamaea pseudoterrestris]